MSVVTMIEAKAHLRVDGADEDADISLKLAAAEDAVTRSLGRPLPWTDASGQPVPVPASVKAAILLLLGDLYAVRESAIVGATRVENETVDRLLAPYRVLSVA